MSENLIFFDIDGTIVPEDGDHKIPDSTIHAIRRTREKGNRVFINTGRVRQNVSEQLLKLGFDGLICGCGTDIYYQGEELFHHTLDPKLCKKIARVNREYGANALYEAAGRTSVDSWFPLEGELKNIVDHFKRYGAYIYETVEDEGFYFDKFAAWYEEGFDYKGYESYMKEWFTIIDRGAGFLEAVPNGYSKATGIGYLCQYLNVDKNHCYAVGDSMNDWSMLSYVPHSICMGNGKEALKQRVEYVTTDIREDGIQNALKHYDLI